MHDWSAGFIAQKIAEDVYMMPDYRCELPELKEELLPITMPDNVAAYYDELREYMCCEDVMAANAAVLVGKLQQCANGFLYREGEDAKRISDYRISAVVAAITRTKGPTLVAY